MRSLSMLALLGASAAAIPSKVIMPLVTFDGAPGTTFKFTQLDDPVMGGKSTGTWSLNSTYGAMDGDVVDVPSLKAPGFITAAADGTFQDVSATLAGGLRLKVRSSTAGYTGYRVSFAAGTLVPAYACAGGGSIPFSRGCFKSKFSVPAGSDFAEVYLPFSSFSDKWSPATGEQTTTCADDKDVCPTAKLLAGILSVELWAEGADGDVNLEVEAITAVAAPSVAATTVAAPQRPPAEFDLCNAAVQTGLKYGISGRTTPAGVQIPVELPNETLATAVCCDERAELAAEPQFLFEAPDIALFSKIDASGVTTFYDSVCGIPLFRAPVDRSFAEFKADTTAHGWPSFRTAEVVFDNIVTNRTSLGVKSKCGTHLGTFDPDAQGDRCASTSHAWPGTTEEPTGQPALPSRRLRA